MAAFLRIILTVAVMGIATVAQAQNRPTLEIDVTGGVSEPMPFAISPFIAENAGASALANEIADVVAADLISTGLFRVIGESAFISRVSAFEEVPQYADWRAINVQALITGAISTSSDGKITAKFRLFDVFAQAPVGDGVQLRGNATSWRRIAHKIADAIYTQITGEEPYFDSKIVFVSETGPKGDRRKQIAIMDHDGAAVQFLTSDDHIVLAPRFSPDARRILYTSLETGLPKVYLMDLATLNRRVIGQFDNMTFAPRFSPDGRNVVMSLIQNGNSDIYLIDLGNSNTTRLTDSPAIETAPSFSPDGSQIVFESDRGGDQQLYVMPAGGGSAQRISFGNGRYATPVWSPRGDLIAFTKIQGGRFHIGVMRPDGTGERLLTASFLDEAPTWSPNGRVLMFFRETAGPNGAPSIYSVDVTGRNLRRINTPSFGSDPAWSSLLN